MFTANNKVYQNTADYAAQHPELLWYGEGNQISAMNDNYQIVIFDNNKVWSSCCDLTGYAPDVETAKSWAQTHYEKYGWKKQESFKTGRVS